METLLDTIAKDFFNENYSYTKNTSYHITDTDDGKKEITINAVGVNPDKITIETSEDVIKIKTDKLENKSRFTNEVNLTFTMGSYYDGNKTKAEFKHGLLVLTVDKKEDKKFKKLNISY